MRRYNNYPRPKGEGVVLGFGCLGILLILAFWAIVIFVCLHFIGKYW